MKMLVPASRLLAAVALLAAASAQAKSAFRTWVPNGLAKSCTTCHIKTTPPVAWNAFGLDVKATLVPPGLPS
jgi:hypothetical protein